MIRNLFLIAVVFMQPCLSASAGWFGPSNYDECILDSMKGVTNNAAAGLIEAACRKKFPATKALSRELLPAETAKISGRAGLSYNMNYFSGNLYNGNSSLTVTRVTIKLLTSSSGKNVERTYNVDVNIPPLTTKDFNMDIVVGDDGTEYQWNIFSVQGY